MIVAPGLGGPGYGYGSGIIKQTNKSGLGGPRYGYGSWTWIIKQQTNLD